MESTFQWLVDTGLCSVSNCKDSLEDIAAYLSTWTEYTMTLQETLIDCILLMLNYMDYWTDLVRFTFTIGESLCPLSPAK